MVDSPSVLICAASERLHDSLSVLLQAHEPHLNVLPVQDCASAGQLLAQEPPALLVLDADLPGAWQVMAQIRVHPRCLLLAHTSEQVRRARDSGIRYVLNDGFSTEAFLNVLREILA